MMMNKLLLFCLSALCFTAQAQIKVEGDPLIKMTPRRLPKQYEQPNGKINKKGAETTTNPINWIVYSDREDNKTYADRNCTKELSTLNFLQPLLVIDETDNEVRVVEYDHAEPPFESVGKKEKIKASAVDKGWIKKTKLLLWSTTLVNDSTRYAIKAIAVKSLGEKQEAHNLINRGKVLDIYNSPVRDKKFQTDRDSKLFEYLFVLKEDRDAKMLLISRKYKTNASNVSQNVLGWVPMGQVHRWDNALCLRINFSDAAMRERKDKNIEPKFFRTMADAKKFKSGTIANSLPFFYGDPDKVEPDNPYYYGFPIIQDAKDNSGLFYTGYVTNTMNDKGEKIFNNVEIAEYNKKFETLKKQKERVNIVYVIDGNALKNWCKPIVSFLKSTSYFNIDNQSTNRYQVGALIFNGVDDNDEEKFMSVSMTGDIEDFGSRMEQKISKLPSLSKRGEEGAPLYEAISKACDMFIKDRTNVIILVGTAKGADIQLKKTTLDKIVNKQVKMACFQVDNRGGSMYDGFLTDTKYLLENSGTIIDNLFSQKSEKSNAFKIKAKLVRAEGDEDKYVLKYSGIPGEINVKDAGEAFTENKLKGAMREFLSKQESSLNSYLNLWKEQTVTGRKEGETDDELIEQQKQLSLMLSEAGIPTSDISQLAEQENFQLFISAYTAIENKNLVNPLLLRTLFMERKEFQRLENAFEEIANASSSNGQRTAVTNAFRQIVYSHVGSVDPKVAEKYSSDDIYRIITSLPKTNNDLFKYTIKELENISKVSDEKIRRLSEDFVNMSRELNRIGKSPLYKYSSDDETFYWVPETVFRIKE